MKLATLADAAPQGGGGWRRRRAGHRGGDLAATPGRRRTRSRPRPRGECEIVRPRGGARHNMAGRLLPLELVDKCIGSRIWVIMKGCVARPVRRRAGTSAPSQRQGGRRHAARLRRIRQHGRTAASLSARRRRGAPARRLPQVLDDVTEYCNGEKTRLDQILLNGNNVSMMVPGGDPEAPDSRAPGAKDARGRARTRYPRPPQATRVTPPVALSLATPPSPPGSPSARL